jgi:hypothetical protein
LTTGEWPATGSRGGGHGLTAEKKNFELEERKGIKQIISSLKYIKQQI